MPKGVECPYAGYVSLALSYADYFDLIPGMDATSLTSSLGYDGSISEMYSAWVSGCAVIMLAKETVLSYHAAWTTMCHVGCQIWSSLGLWVCQISSRFLHLFFL